MKELMKLAYLEWKSNPAEATKEIIGSILLLGTMGFIFYWALWIVCPC